MGLKPVDSIRKTNRAKYGVPPTWEQIDAVLKKCRMNVYRFEEFYNLPYNHLAKVKCGLMNLGTAYWHLIYEYGKRPKRPKKAIIPKTVPSQHAKADDYIKDKFSPLK